MSSSSHEIVLTSSPNGTIVAYDVNSGTTLAQFTGSHSPRRGLTVVGKDFEKSYIASSHVSPTTGSASVHLYNWCPIHNKAVTCLAINPDESLLISGSDEGTIAVVPIFRLIGDSGCENAEDIILHKFAAHSDSVTAVVSGTGLFYSQIISCSANSTCKFWSLRRGTLMRTVLFPCVISAIALHPTEPAFYAAGSDGLIYTGSFMVGSRKLVIHDTELITLPPKHSSAVVSVVFVQTGRYLVSASENGVVWIWDVAKGQVVTALGNEIVSISDLVPATGFNPKKRSGRCCTI